MKDFSYPESATVQWEISSIWKKAFSKRRGEEQTHFRRQTWLHEDI